MLARRIIPCLDVRDGRVVKGTNFQGLRDMADPVDMARFYNRSGADELVFYDITASAEERALFTDILTEVASTIFIPLTVGGGINTVDDFDRVLKCGADKVSVNSGALRDPSLISAAARRYGVQCVVLSVDAKRVDGQYRVFAKGGREDTGLDAIEHCQGRGGGHRRGGVRGGGCAGGRLRRGRVRGALPDALPDPAQGGRRAGGLHLPLWGGCHFGLEAGTGGGRHPGKRSPCCPMKRREVVSCRQFLLF